MPILADRGQTCGLWRRTTTDSLGALPTSKGVPRDSFLRRLRDLIDWDRFTDRFVTMYVGKAEHGRPPYHPVLVFKCLLRVREFILLPAQTGLLTTTCSCVQFPIYYMLCRCERHRPTGGLNHKL